MMRTLARAGVLSLVLTGGAGCGAGAESEVATAEVTRGAYVDVVEIRGDVRPVRTTYVTAPRNAGELRILKLARSGTEVKAGDVVADFDAVTMRRTIQEKESELRAALAEQEQTAAQATITLEERAATVRKAGYDLDRARLALGATGVGGVELVSAMEARSSVSGTPSSSSTRPPRSSRPTRRGPWRRRWCAADRPGACGRGCGCG
jgi:multidrug efflux pump subunit AcrA (membrane-fusion protein)